MFSVLRYFVEDESGAVTVDWVVLTAAILGLGMLVLNPIAFQTSSFTRELGDGIQSSPVGFENN